VDQIALPLVPANTLDPRKFQNAVHTAAGDRRATVALTALETLWFNTGTLCNLTCRRCYIESSPRNDRLAYLTRAEVRTYLDEIARDHLPTRLIGFTGGEPFMNPDIIAMLADVLDRGLDAIVLTNAMTPMTHHRAALLTLRERHGNRLAIRVSLDHHTQAVHEAERGARTWKPTIDGLVWLARNGFAVHVAGRHFTAETDAKLRAGYARLFAALDVPVDALDPVRLMLFPEMDATRDVPEITTACWGILKKSPDSVMCASARMVVKRKDAASPAVVACTLLPYDPRFEMGGTLAEASRPVALNHPHCAAFCVLGGASCSRG
jgi:uncharacterized Fe-S cluster-containing radical SAM superfamily protein